MHGSRPNLRKAKAMVVSQHIPSMEQEETDFKKVDLLNSDLLSETLDDINEPFASTSMTEDSLPCKEYAEEEPKEEVKIHSEKAQTHKQKGRKREKGEHQALPHHSKAVECQKLMPAEELEVEAEQTALEESKVKNDSRGRRKNRNDATKKPQIVEDNGFFKSLKVTNTLLGRNIVCSTCKTNKLECRLVDDDISFERRILFYCRTCKEILSQIPAFDPVEFPEFAPDLESTPFSCDLDRVLTSLVSADLAKCLSDPNIDFHTAIEFQLFCQASAAAMLQKWDDNIPTSDANGICDLIRVSTSVGSSGLAKCLSDPNNDYHTTIEFCQSSATILQKWDDNIPTSDANGSCDIDRVLTSLGSSGLAKYLSNPNNDYHTERGFQLFSQASAVILQKWDENVPLIVDIIKKMYREVGKLPDEQGIVNIAVIYYGSFVTRGHDSLIGVGVIVEAETGLIIDIHVSSKYCVLCKREWGRKTKAEFDVWYETHHKLCLLNCEKELTDNLESDIAIFLFKRSTDLGLRYTAFIEASNSAVYTKLCDKKVYGDQHEIKKMCILEHMFKIIYRRLELLRTVGHLGGPGVGFLRKGENFVRAAIYRTACRLFPDNHPKIRNFFRSYIAHLAATDENPTHNLCNSRNCRYKQEVEKGNILGPGWHRENIKYHINDEVASELKKFFNKYIQESFLARVTGHGEYSDKILRAKIWDFLPNAGKEGVEFVKTFVAYVALEHNEELEEAAIH